MNRLERDWAQELDLRRLAGDVQAWSYEGIRLSLGPGAWYTPDFLVVRGDGFLECHETKGYWREAARVRIKVAAGLFPYLRFLAIQRAPEGSAERWAIEEIGS